MVVKLDNVQLDPSQAIILRDNAPINNLPDELLKHIFDMLQCAEDQNATALVCKKWRNIVFEGKLEVLQILGMKLNEFKNPFSEYRLLKKDICRANRNQWQKNNWNKIHAYLQNMLKTPEMKISILTAAKFGLSSTLKKSLQDKQVDIEQGQDTEIEYKTQALLAAAKNGHIHAVKTLVKNGVDINSTSSGDSKNRTAIVRAAQNSPTDIIKELFDLGADINVNQEEGNHVFWEAMTSPFSSCNIEKKGYITKFIQMAEISISKMRSIKELIPQGAIIKKDGTILTELDCENIIRGQEKLDWNAFFDPD